MDSSSRASYMILLLLTVALLGLAGCDSSAGGGGASAAPAPPSPPAPPPPPPVLGGAGSAAAVTMLTTTHAAPAAAADVSAGHVLTRLIVVLEQGATVDQLNAAARQVGATRILTSKNGLEMIALEVPRQASVGALRALARTLAAQPGIALAFAATTFKSAVLPEQSTGVPVSPLAVSHLRATRFPQAWNARGAEDSGCLPRRVAVYVWDEFGPVTSEFLTLMHDDGFDTAGDVAEGGNGHGYDVALTLAAKFDAAVPTGAVPFEDCALLHQIEAGGHDTLTATVTMMEVLGAETGRFVLNNSMNFREPSICGPLGTDPCTVANAATLDADSLRGELVFRLAVARVLADEFAALVATDRALITVSAGNLDSASDEVLANRYRGFRDARFANVFELATHLDDIDVLLQDPELWSSADPQTPDATFDQTMVNDVLAVLASIGTAPAIDAAIVLTVDSGTNVETAEAVAPSSAFDFLGADLRAVGENVSLGASETVTGTSFAAPQVAALAAYLWTISDELVAQPTSATADLILRTSRPATGGVLAVPLVDAYLAALSTDRPGGPLKVRRALVDANDDGVFDHLDLLRFAQAYDLANPNRPTIPAARDFSRFDLNGDGFTGGIPISVLDLDVSGDDANGLPSIEAVDAAIEGYDISFNEAALSDIQILCYYAYAGTNGNAGQTPLYDSRQEALDERTAMLGPDHCVGARMDALLPSEITGPTTLDVLVELPSGNGQFAPAPNLRVEFSPTCASVNPTSGQTAANGRVSATVTPSAGCASLSVDVTARANASSSPLAQQRVTAGTLVAVEGFVGSITVTFTATDTVCNPNVPCVTETMSHTEVYELQVNSGFGVTSGAGFLSMSATSQILMFPPGGPTVCDRSFSISDVPSQAQSSDVRSIPLRAEFAGGPGEGVTCIGAAPVFIAGVSTIHVLPQVELVGGVPRALVWDGSVDVPDPVDGNGNPGQSAFGSGTRLLTGRQTATGRLERVP
jgi:hypothetical protein